MGLWNRMTTAATPERFRRERPVRGTVPRDEYGLGQGAAVRRDHSGFATAAAPQQFALPPRPPPIAPGVRSHSGSSLGSMGRSNIGPMGMALPHNAPDLQAVPEAQHHQAGAGMMQQQQLQQQLAQPSPRKGQFGIPRQLSSSSLSQQQPYVPVVMPQRPKMMDKLRGVFMAPSVARPPSRPPSRPRADRSPSPSGRGYEDAAYARLPVSTHASAHQGMVAQGSGGMSPLSTRLQPAGSQEMLMQQPSWQQQMGPMQGHPPGPQQQQQLQQQQQQQQQQRVLPAPVQPALLPLQPQGSSGPLQQQQQQQQLSPRAPTREGSVRHAAPTTPPFSPHRQVPLQPALLPLPSSQPPPPPPQQQQQAAGPGASAQQVRELQQKVALLESELQVVPGLRRSAASEQKASIEWRERWNSQNLKLNLMVDMMALRLAEAEQPSAAGARSAVGLLAVPSGAIAIRA